MLNDKESDVLQFLIDRKEAIPLSEVANYFSLSERSIRYYIQNINDTHECVHIIKRMCHIIDRDATIAFLSSHQSQLYTSDMKQRLLIYHLLFEGVINLTAFSQRLDISRSSVKTYIETIRKELEDYHLQLKQDHKAGLRLDGSEHHIRLIQLHYRLTFSTLSKTNKKIIEPIIATYENTEVFHKIDLFLQQIQKELSFVLSDISYDMIRYYLVIMIYRNTLHQTITTCDNEYFLITCAEYNAVLKHFPLLQIKNTNEHYEILHLTSLLIGAHYAKSCDIRENNWFEHDLLVTKIISLYSHYYGINLNHDRSLYESLLTHLRPTMYRLMNGITFSEVDYHDVKQSFYKEYETMQKVLNELNFFTNEVQDRNEIALLTLHFKAALQRYEKDHFIKKRILIVCSHGYGTSRLLEQQLVDTYEIEVLDCIPFHQLKNYEHLAILDAIITTIDDLKTTRNIPILQVHPILNADDISKLSNILQQKQNPQVRMSLLLDAIKKTCTIHELSELKNDLKTLLGDAFIQDDVYNQTLLDILPLKNIRLHYDANNWQEAIQLAGDLLVEHGYVNDEYRKQMQYSFENYGSYMMIDDGIAIPHAKNEGNVYQTGMTLVTLKKPVLFTNGKPLQVFFSFCSKDNIEHLDALMALANLIKETNFKSEINTFQNEEEVLQYLISHHIQ